MIKRILVPIDFSSCSTRAARYALRLARSVGAKLTVVHVVESHHVLASDVHNATHETVAELERYAALEGTDSADMVDFREVAGIFAEAEVVEGVRCVRGHPRDAIATLADEGFDLVVMGSHGRGGLSQLIMGSVSEQVIRRSHCPVLVVRYDDRIE